VQAREIAGVFLRLGITGFGGPAAHIALMRDEFVRRRQWMKDDEFLEMVGIANLIPGPNSTELAMHIGSRQAGKRGLFVAGACFIIPAVVIVACIAWLYSEYGTSPAVIDVRYGVLPVIIAIIAHALTGLGRSTLVSSRNVVIASAAFVAYLFNVHELIILVVAGIFAIALSMIVKYWTERKTNGRTPLMVGIGLLPFGVAEKSADIKLWRLFLVFLEIGAVLYGSGYVLLAFLENQLVNELGWLTSQQLLDAVAVGQVTPGPLFSTATFIGWQVAGVWGSVVATVGIFLPSFVFVSLLVVIVPWVRRHTAIQTFINGVTIASLGLMAGVLVDLVDDALVDPFTIAIAAVSLMVLLISKVNTTWLVAAGVAIGVTNHFL
jgi:chromate transporter